MASSPTGLPQPSSSQPPLPIDTSLPPSLAPPPPTVSPPPPVDTSPPPVVVSPPPPSAPPPSVPPPPAPTFSPPPLPPPSVPPPTPNASPPSPDSPVTAPPPLTPPPPSATPPTSSPPPPFVSPPAPAPPLSPPITPSSSAPVGNSPPPPPSNSSSVDSASPPAPLSSPVINTTISTSGKSSNPSSSSGGGGLNAGATVGVVITVLIVLSFVGLAVWFIKKRKKSVGGYEAGFIMPSSHSSPLSSVIMTDSPYPKSPSAPLVYHQRSGSVASDAGLSSSKSWFPYEELYEITNGFSPQNILGEGGFGCVYKGVLSDGREVAVKQLKAGSGQGEREFKAEVEIISRIHHRHLVSLVGYCISESHRLLVYDFVANGTLEAHLYGKGKPPLTWPTRVRVAAGSARGLAYLHEDCHPRIIHRDIKSSNILLDNNYEAQVADFGLARLAMDAHTHVTTRVMGTFGYLAPEYASSGKLTEKSDVFSFGVVLLEIITGRKPVDGTRPLGDESLVEWARPMLSHTIETGEFGELPDPRLEGNYDQTEMFRMIEAAAACVRHSATMRPKMSKVVRVLDSLADTDIDNGIKPGQSEMFNVARTADIRLLQKLAFGTQEFSSSEFSQSNWSRQSDI